MQVRDYMDSYDAETKRLVAVAEDETNFHALSEDYSNKMNFVIEKVVMRDPSMLEKRLLVIPKCASQHWSAVFVFNASFIELVESRSWRESAECLHPCFFRYCSMCPDGTRKVPTSDGTVWFLNLLFSYSKHIKLETTPTDGMKWLAPFGKVGYNGEFGRRGDRRFYGGLSRSHQ